MKPETPDTRERRHTPRHEIHLMVDLVLQNGSMLPVHSCSISDSGIQVVCNSWAAHEIEPRGIQTHSVNHIKVKAVLELPVTDNQKKLYTLCKIISARRLSQNEYILNLAYIEFENGSEKVLDSYLDQYQQKKTVLEAIA